MTPARHRGVPPVAVLCSIAALLLTGCGGADEGDAAGTTADPWQAVAGFYPLQYVTERVGGDLVEVTNLTKPGAEPHDLELAPQDVATLSAADLAVYLEGFQAAVDEAVAQAGPGQTLEVSDAADLSLTYVEQHEEGAEHPEGAEVTDPHFWLDPLRLADVGDSVAASLSQLDPAAQSTFEANAAELRADLESLDQEFRTGLQSCESTDLVTSHAAFGYLATAYGLEQLGITGLSPETEPSPQDLAEVVDFVRANDVRTIYFETLVSPDIAKTVAGATGANIDVLDPIEGLSDDSQGGDYVEIMQSNLANLKAGQSCR